MFRDNVIEPSQTQRQERPNSLPEWDDSEIVKQHSLYTADRWNGRHYYTDFQQKAQIVRATDSRIVTQLDDRQTVSMVLDLAEARAWKAITIRGSDDFKRETWVQAQLRGIETLGYRPQETDRQELTRRQAAAGPVQSAARPAQPSPTKETSVAERRKQRAAEAGVWGEVERVGQEARKQQSSSASQAAKAGDQPKPRVEAV